MIDSVPELQSLAMRLHHRLTTLRSAFALSTFIILGSGCRDERDVGGVDDQDSREGASPKAEVRIDGPEMEDHAPGAGTREADVTAEGIQTNVEQLITDSGLLALRAVFSSYTGKEQDEAMVIAIDELAKTHSKSNLLDALNEIPPGSNKQKWIWSAITRGAGGYDEELFSSIQSLNYPEERSTAVHAFASQSSVGSLEDLSRGMEFLDRNEDLGSQFIESMKNNLIDHYSASIYERGPGYASSQLLEIPEDLRDDAAKRLTKTFMWSDPEDALEFANDLSQSPELAAGAFSTLFKDLGRADPDDYNSFISKVPKDYRETALQSFIDGWMSQNSIGATEWLLEQPAEERAIGAASVVRFLEHKQAPQEEILPWKRIMKGD